MVPRRLVRPPRPLLPASDAVFTGDRFPAASASARFVASPAVSAAKVVYYIRGGGTSYALGFCICP